MRSCLEVQTACGVSSRQLEDKEESQCLTCARMATVSLWKTTFGGSLGGNVRIGGAQFVERNTTGSRPRYSKHMQYLRAFCANLFNALKMLATQQEDGDGLLQHIVKDLGKESRKGLANGLREFIKVDNERALDVGSLSRRTRTFSSTKAERARRVPGGDSHGEPG